MLLIEDYVSKIESKINKQVDKAKSKFGDSFDENSTEKQILGFWKINKKLIMHYLQ